MCVTLREAANILANAFVNKLGGDACLVLSLTDSGIENIPIHEIELVEDNDGAVIEIRAKLPDIGIDWKKLWDDFDTWLEEAEKSRPICMSCWSKMEMLNDPNDWETQQVKIEELVNRQLRN